jgi:hypothetical protein
VFTWPPALGVVDRVGDALATLTVSEPQSLKALLFAASPLYMAFQFQVPAALVGVVLVVEYEPLPDTDTVCMKTAVPTPHVWDGLQSQKGDRPAGDAPPDNTPVSLRTLVPTVPPGLGVVVSVGEAFEVAGWPQTT